jgi:hypothetical protein
MFDNSLSISGSGLYNTRAAKIALAAAVAATAVMLLAAVVPAAFADVKGSADTSCTNNGGQQPGGQQPSCQGSGLTQETCNATTGSGKCPAGQNK